jgi:Kef-type K+ transport system membrane component KefB/mannitol/fructose-specific phosphotransferase system IIA component (Ntr-type)
MEMPHRMMLLAIQLGVILFAARLGNILFERMRLPGALGELTAGILIGPYLLGAIHMPGFAQGLFPIHDGMAISPELNGITAVGAVVLLFVTGLETDIGMLLRYSLAGFVVGAGGVIISLLMGMACVAVFATWLLGESFGLTSPTSLFLGIILSATSVGITARILSERRKLDSPEGVTILSAAVIDDVVGIILLAVVLGFVTASRNGGGVDWAHIAMIGTKAVGVWLIATALGLLASRQISVMLKLFGRRTTIAVMALGMALVLAGLFEEAGLAMIIGAYVMGLSLSRSDISHMVQEKLTPLYEFFIPVFFCVMGMRIDIGQLASPAILGFGLLYALAALASKLLGCGLPALGVNFNLRGAARVGFGMAPRCEVALIIAGIGLGAGVLDQQFFAAVVMMVLVNSVVAPAALALLYRSDASGTRKTVSVAAGNRRKTLFEFPSVEMTEFMIGRLTKVFDDEGFFIHLVSHQRRMYQLRKDKAVIDFHRSGTHLAFDCAEVYVPLVQTAVHEATADLERTVRGLRSPVESQTVAAPIQTPVAAAGAAQTLRNHLSPELILPKLSGQGKEEIIDELLDALHRRGKIHDLARARKAIWDREKSMSTGLQHGVAIPHGKSDSVDRLVAAVGLKKEGADFESMDGQPSRIFILTLSPQSKPAPHVEFMSAVSQVLDETGRNRLLACESAGEIYRALTEPSAAKSAPGPGVRFELKDYLSPDVLEPSLQSSSKKEVLDELLALLFESGKVRDLPAVRAAVLAREEQMSTGMQDGIAIPHGRSEAVEELVCAVGVRREGIDFGAVDGQASRIFILAVTPPRGSDPYLQFAAAMISVLDEAGRARVLAARTPNQLYEAIVSGKARR